MERIRFATSTAAASQRGITLIELLVTLAIIAVALSIVGPPIGSSVDRVRLRSFANELVADARFGRNAAITTGTTWMMRFEEDRVVVSAAESGDGPSRAIEFPEGTHLATDPGIVIFLTSGRAVGPETIRIANRSGQEQTLRRDASGKLRRADQPEAAGDRLP